ncbi:DUF4296 domain-containing protein [Flavihumibacter profundi]|uniref:DUF4296 domain-containing protein n=1 Tax=Flavihumibacter profundi TaxID=2716883 RepID=UPI001CC8242D|nr:DUF4296 domain-containing protein [Flavihumibacter profundi]MBZ5857269.1 DUF4296 domain-containing protein [Flavihumibacter profundi]
MRLKWHGIIILLCSFLGACQNNKAVVKPALSDKEMVPVIYELLLSEECSIALKGRDTTLVLPELRSVKYQQVFQLHKIDQKTFADSYSYYLGHPNELKIIFDSVEAMGSRNRLEFVRPLKQMDIYKKPANPK